MSIHETGLKRGKTRVTKSRLGLVLSSDWLWGGLRLPSCWPISWRFEAKPMQSRCTSNITLEITCYFTRLCLAIQARCCSSEEWEMRSSQLSKAFDFHVTSCIVVVNLSLFMAFASWLLVSQYSCFVADELIAEFDSHHWEQMFVL